MNDIIERDVRRFVIDNFLFGEGGNDLKNGDSFLGRGIIDSTGTLELVTFLEKNFRVKIEDQELVPEHLDSIDRVVALIMGKQATKN